MESPSASADKMWDIDIDLDIDIDIDKIINNNGIFRVEIHISILPLDVNSLEHTFKYMMFLFIASEVILLFLV